MLGLALTAFPIPIRIPNQTTSKPFPISPIRNKKPPNSYRKRNPRTRGFLVFASKEVSFDELRDSSGNNGGGGGGNAAKEEDSEKNNGRPPPPPRLNLKWSELLLHRDPDNVVAVALTAVLAWASVWVLWQLFAISSAILVAAVKYSFIAALLIFVLIILL